MGNMLSYIFSIHYNLSGVDAEFSKKKNYNLLNRARRKDMCRNKANEQTKQRLPVVPMSVG